MKYIRYNADDETPDCGQCDFVCDGFDCENNCGPEHGWYGYSRAECIPEQSENIEEE